MVRYGEETDWKQVELVETLTCAGLKQDGSLWAWESGPLAWRHHAWPPRFVPLSQYTIWAGMCSDNRELLAFGRDGSLCRWNLESGHLLEATRFDPTWLLLPSRIHAREIADLAAR